MGKFCVGLDLGQAQDYTALAIAEQAEVDGKTHYAVRHLERFKLGTLYPAIVTRVAELMRHRDWELIVDQTGVGRAVFDMLGEAGLRPIGVTIHGGDKVTSDGSGYRVPKRELIGTMQAFLQSKRLQFAEGLPEVPALVKELLAFQVKIDVNTAHDSYGAWREHAHDDLILAVSLAVWFAERGAGQEATTAPNVFYDPDPRVIAQLSQRKPTYLVHNWVDCKVKDCPDCSEEIKAAMGRGEI